VPDLARLESSYNDKSFKQKVKWGILLVTLLGALIILLMPRKHTENDGLQDAVFIKEKIKNIENIKEGRPYLSTSKG
jgi:hypothetical protein